MSDGIWSALSGAVAQQRSLEVVANNVANVNTVGFRADRVVFREVLSQVAPDGPAPASVRFVAVDDTVSDVSAGALQDTGHPLHLALEGDGYLAVRTPAGERYTRAGALSVDDSGTVRTADGHALLVDDPAGPRPLVLPSGYRELSVSERGEVTADGNGLGRLRLVSFDQAPDKEGLTLFDGRGARPAADVRVRQGFLESANVNAVAGMNELITVSRSFEAFQKVIDGFRALDERTAREVATRQR
ncbi:MAG: flagellar hook-basal body protein [Sandaracinus sp.]|nr:flagellar hook-basal body protein [Sandaracinus sp.]MCB9632471.1 flagellar hook-basal body protein [Sandaracinus sp.]